MRASAILLLATLACSSCDKSRNPVKLGPEPGGKILFYGLGTGSDTGNTHLYFINPDGTGKHQVTADQMSDSQPRWSPDGTQIIFIRINGGGDSANVTVVDAAGTNLRRLTHNRTDANPSWSPDGAQVAYQHDDELLYDVWAMNADGVNQHVIMSRDSTNLARDVTWTSQGTLIGDDPYGLDLQLDPTATKLTRILDLYPLFDGTPRLSPDGSRIVFSWTGPNYSHSPYIYTVRPDGTDIKQLTNGSDTSPVWSLDGMWIAYVHNGRVWIMHADGTGPRQVTKGIANGADNLGDWR